MLRLDGRECREHITMASMCDNASQQEVRVWRRSDSRQQHRAAGAEVAQKGQASPVRVEVAQENRDEEITEASVTIDTENVKPRIEESGKIPTEVTS